MVESYAHPEGKVDGLTVYKEEFINRGPATVPKITRPQTVIAKNDSKFQSQTTHNSTFTPKKPIPQQIYGELPSFTGSILFPDPKADMKTTNQDVYKGRFAKVADLCKPAEAQVTIGIEGDHFHGTTHRDTFKTPEMEGRREARKRQPQLKANQRAKFQSQTQFKSDFPGYGGKMPNPPKPITPPPETVNLAMNNNRHFSTTNNEFYKIIWDPKTIGRTKILKPDGEAYSKPLTKMETKTQAMRDFTQKEPVKMPQIRPPTRTEPSKSKFFDETAYKSQFKHYRTAPFQRYGDLHESAFYLKPVTKFYQDGSVTMQDFQGAAGGKPSTPHLPVQKLHVRDGELLSQTTYNSDYIRKAKGQCSYLQWMQDRETKKKAAKITLQKTTEPQKIGKALKQHNQEKSGVLVGNK